jgi:hypothetical protein
MKNKKTTGIALLAVGVILLIISLAADVIGIGNWAGFGLRQFVGTISGVILAVVGFVLISGIIKNRKTAGIALLVAGVILLIISLAADVIGIGNSTGFGLGQIAGAVVGVIAAVLGFVFSPRKKKEEPTV